MSRPEQPADPEGESEASTDGSRRDDSISTRRLQQAIWGFVGLGLALRIFRYLLSFPLSRDEAKLALSWIDRDFLQLLEPLDYWQVAPTLYLWTNLVVIRLAGFQEWSLRLLPFVLGVASLFLMRRLSLRLLPPVPALLAVALFSVSYYPVRFASESKPYSGDLFFALALLVLGTAALRQPGRPRRLIALALVAPIAVGMSYPSVFVIGAIGLVLLLPVWRTGAWRPRAAWLGFVAAGFLTFLVAYLGVARDQHANLASLASNVDFWRQGFPPTTQPLAIATWLLSVHTGRTFGYPLGAANGGGLLTFVCFVLGAIALHRSGKTTLLWMLLLPFALTLSAALLKLYPYGGSGRISQHLTPAICLLAGLGLAGLLAAGRRAPGMRALAASLGFLAFFGVALAVVSALRPYQDEIGSVHSRDFARRLWTERGENGELACAVTDSPTGARHRGRLPFLPRYFANQKIYWARHHRAERLALDRVSAARPLRVVVPTVVPDSKTLAFLTAPVVEEIAESEAEAASWLDHLRMDYRQVAAERLKVEEYAEREVWIDLLELVPTESAAR